MAFTIYRYTDNNAPQLTGLTSSFNTILSASLVTGYGTMPAAGWTASFSSSTKMVFQQGSGSAKMFLRSDDSGYGINASYGGTREVRMTGYENMISVDSGSNPFPTNVQQSSGTGAGTASVMLRKSNTNDATTRPWILFADSRTFYFFNQSGDNTNNYYGFGFGDIYSFTGSANDAYRCMIMGRIGETTSPSNEYQLEYTTATSAVGGMAAVGGHFIVRSYSQSGTSVNFGMHGDGGKQTNNITFYGNIPYPNPSDGAYWLAPAWITEPSTNTIRGQMRGFWIWLHTSATSTYVQADGSTFSGSGDLAGKIFQTVYPATSNNSSTSPCVIEISNTLPG